MTIRFGSAPIRLEKRATAVLAEDVAHRPAGLPDRGAGAQRLLDRRQEVALTLCPLSKLAQPGAESILVAIRLPLRQSLELPALGLRVDGEDVDVVDLLADVLVDADDDVLARSE